MIEGGRALVAGRAPRDWRRLLVAVGLGVVSLAVVGMHQLSLGHLFVTTADPAVDGHAHAASSPAGVPRVAVEMTSMAAMPGTTADGYDGGAAAPAGSDSALEGGCTSCGDHMMGPASCLLAMTLLVLFWWLRLPLPRPLPPLRRERRSRVSLRRRRPRIYALSLLELSILRT